MHKTNFEKLASDDPRISDSNIHQKNPHCTSFPTMYNNMGLKLKENDKKNVLSKEMTVFLTFSLPKFSIASVCTVLVNNFMLTVQQFDVPTIVAWK